MTGKEKVQLDPSLQKAFKNIKKAFAKETFLNYPKLDVPFEIHTEDINRQLGTALSQYGEILALYCRKLSSAQKTYTITKQELLRIVKTLREFYCRVFSPVVKFIVYMYIII